MEGLTESEELTEGSEEATEGSEEASQDSEVENSESELEKAITILKNSADPEELLLLWEKTSMFRKDFLKESDVVTYMQTFPCLLTNSGYQLVWV